MIEQIFSPELIGALGWTLVHTLWQAAIFALLLGALLVGLRRFSSQARYVVATGLLAAFFLTVGATFIRQYTPANSFESFAPAVSQDNSPVYTQEPGADAGATFINNETVPPPDFRSRVASYYSAHLPLIVTLWLMGVLILQLRWLGQLAYVQRLKSYGTSRMPARWLDRIGELEDRLGIRRPIRYLTSLRVNSPLTAGWLRPVVLFPPALLEELKESQVIAILAHELAHVRRHDFLVNLAQTLLGTLFFYHPGVWWMNARIREEREHCCDDLAILATGQPAGYARTLVQLKEAAGGRGQLAMAFTGTAPSAFHHRISRLFTGGGAATYGEGVLTAGIVVVALFTASMTTGGAPAPDRSDPSATALSLAPVSEEVERDSTPGISPETDAIIADVRRKVTEFATERETDPIENPGAFVEAFVEKMQESPTASLARELDGLPTGLTDFELLMEAIRGENVRLTEYFLERVSNLDQVDREGFSPLMAAVSDNTTEIVRLLLEKGANVDFSNAYGWTALIEAADEGATESMRYLMRAGADLNYVGTGNNRSAVSMAASEGHLDILQLLLEAGAELTPPGGTPPLHIAAGERQYNIVCFLVKRKDTDVNELDRQGRSALSYAYENNADQVIDLLLEKGADRQPGDRYEREYYEERDHRGHHYDSRRTTITISLLTTVITTAVSYL